MRKSPVKQLVTTFFSRFGTPVSSGVVKGGGAGGAGGGATAPIVFKTIPKV